MPSVHSVRGVSPFIAWDAAARRREQRTRDEFARARAARGWPTPEDAS